MTKKLAKVLLITLIIITSLVCTIVFSGCRKDCRNGGDHWWIENIDMSWLGGESSHKDATCTDDGYTDYYCNYCNYCFKKKREVLPALGHKTTVDKEGVAPTCTTEGIDDVSHCSVCNVSLGNGETLPKLPHNEQNTEEDIQPTCSSTGLQSETRCIDCGVVVKQRKVLPMVPHTAVIDIPAVNPTCLQNGLTAKSHCSVCGITISEQTVIPATPNKHNFDKDNFKCVDCGIINSQFKAITNANDLQNINLNLTGKYYLANNIDLKNENWEPIGRGYGDFTGTFMGNGFSINNLNCVITNNSSKKSTVGGLFERNSGKLCNITVTNFTVSITFNEEADNTLKDDDYGNVSATYGAIVGENRGSIENCTVSGTVQMQNNRSLKKYIIWAADGGNHTDISYSYFGGIAGINSGSIDNCTNSSSFTCSVTGFVQSMMGMFGGVNSGDAWNVVFYGDMGGIVGYNRSNGKISNCKVSGSVVFNSNLTANCVSNNKVPGWECRVQNSMVVGALVGTNEGLIQECKSKKISINRNHSKQGVTSKDVINDYIVNTGTNGFYGKNNGGNIEAIEII